MLAATGAENESALARPLKISTQAVSDAMRRGRVPDRWVRQIAEDYNVSADWLYFGRGQMRPEDNDGCEYGGAVLAAENRAKAMPGAIADFTAEQAAEDFAGNGLAAARQKIARPAHPAPSAPSAMNGQSGAACGRCAFLEKMLEKTEDERRELTRMVLQLFNDKEELYGKYAQAAEELARYREDFASSRENVADSGENIASNSENLAKDRANKITPPPPPKNNQ